jgi:hypothetical protein
MGVEPPYVDYDSILDEEFDFGRLRVETLRSGWSGATF